MTVVLSTETEYGVYRPGDAHANAIALSTDAVSAYTPWARGPRTQGATPVEWDYQGEDPLNDLRGRRLDRASVDPSLLTDDPYHLAPSGGVEHLPRPGEAERAQIRPTGMVIPNGGRLYVDHAHPEYSAPETTSALQGVLYDRAGVTIARRIMQAASENGGEPLVLVKNNVDGKGATYGTHENYQVPRSIDLDDLIRALIPFLVTRPILCGAGRVGLGQRSEKPGFQISQRADYVENDIGLQTTFNRPIFNTRDEPHADGNLWRRIHVIGGDANLFDVSILAKLGTTALVLKAIEIGTGLEWDALDLQDPVGATQVVSRDLTLGEPLALLSGAEMTAVEIQESYLRLVKASFERSGATPTPPEAQVIELWEELLHGLRADLFSLSAKVEWVAKYRLLLAQKKRNHLNWDSPRLAAMDLQWGDLRANKSLVAALDRAGAVERLFSEAEVERAADEPPADTRARIRGEAVWNDPHLVRASWTSLVYDLPEKGEYHRLPLPQTTQTTKERL